MRERNTCPRQGSVGAGVCSGLSALPGPQTKQMGDGELCPEHSGHSHSQL